MKNKIDQYLAANVFDNQPPSSLTLHGGDQLQKEIDHLYEDVIGPEIERLEEQVSELTKHGKRYTDFGSQAQQIEELKRENEKMREALVESIQALVGIRDAEGARDMYEIAVEALR